MIGICKYCKNPFNYTSSSTGTYCSNSCQGRFTSENIVRLWKEGKISATNKGGQLRRPITLYIKERDNYSCVICGWSKVNPTSNTIPVEVNHIDGDASNNVESNLRTLCPCCHSLTPTWKNTGPNVSKREYRRKQKI
jgi:5-methylcytosine-specific restriction endonuclease McrA